MANPLPLFLVGGAALMIVASGKRRPKKKKGPQNNGVKNSLPPKELPSTPEESPEEPGPSEEWGQRQEALKFLATVKIRAQDGGLALLCAECDPGKVDGVFGEKTLIAVKAFQALAGLPATGAWGVAEDGAMREILLAIESGAEIPCNPQSTYPDNLACVELADSGFGLQAKSTANTPSIPPGDASGDPFVGPTPAYGPDEILVADADCNYIIHQSDQWFDEQRNRVIAYALEDMVDAQAANEINESMLADYIPLCFTLGRLGVGPGVREFWDANVGLIFTQLQAYASVPEVLEEDAYKYGIL